LKTAKDYSQQPNKTIKHDKVSQQFMKLKKELQPLAIQTMKQGLSKENQLPLY
jgi:hypothetical protein